MAHGGQAGQLVGTPTDQVTQFDRRIYETPEGEKVSEKSATLFLNGNWMNVPSIHGGKLFTEDQLRSMIKKGVIEPTSIHKSRPEAETAAMQRSEMIKHRTKGFKDGQLVSNTVDGSRPGYSGKLALKVTQALNKIIPYRGATTIGTSSPKLSRKPELKFIKLFNQLKDTNFSGNLRKTSESINQSPERIKGILNRTLGPGSKSSGHKPVISLPEPKNGILYSQTTTNMKSNPDAFRELITPQTKDLYLSPRDIASKLGINFKGDKGQYDFFVKDLKDLKVTNKFSSGNQKFFNFNDATNKILNKYKTKKIKGERLAESNRLEIEMKLDLELYRIRSNNKQTIKTISKDENIYLKNAVDDLGHTVSIVVTDKYPKLFKNSNVNNINTLVYQDPYLNQDVMKLTGYETRFDSMFKELETLVNKPVTAKTQKKILDIKQSMNQNYNGLIKNLTDPVALKYIMKRSGKDISPSHLKTLSQQTNRIPKIDVKVPKIGEKFLSENIYADMSKVDPQYIMGYVDTINPTAKKFKDLSLPEQKLYKENLLDQSGMIVRDYYKKVGYPKGQLDELQEAVTFDRYASGGEVKRTGFEVGGDAKKILKTLAKDSVKPGGWIGGDILVSTIFTGNALLEGKTFQEAIDQGLGWFLPKEVLDSYKKALTKGMSEQEATYIKRAFDMELVNRKYGMSSDELDTFEKKLKENPELFENVTDFQIIKNRERLKKNMKEASEEGTNLLESFGDFERKGSGSDLPYIEGVTSNAPTDEEYNQAYEKAMEKLYQAQKQKAVTEVNKSKQFDLGREYSKYLNDVIMPDQIEEALGKGDKNYQDYDMFGNKSGQFTDYIPSPTRPASFITAPIGQLAQGYAATNLPFADNLQNYLEKIAISRNKKGLTEPSTVDNLTQEEFNIANDQFSTGGLASLKRKL
jgi:hypothetical protein